MIVSYKFNILSDLGFQIGSVDGLCAKASYKLVSTLKAKQEPQKSTNINKSINDDNTMSKEYTTL